MFAESKKLERMVDHDIPEAFPIIETSGSPEGEWGQYFTQDEFFGARETTELEDANRSQSIINELLSSVNITMMLVTSLYPTEIRGVAHEIKIKDAFDSTKEWLENAKFALEGCQKTILSSTNNGIKTVINRKNLRLLKDHITKIGYNFFRTKKPPEELLLNTILEEQSRVIDNYFNNQNNPNTENNQPNTRNQRSTYQTEAEKFRRM
jgi:hypothetical protein